MRDRLGRASFIVAAVVVTVYACAWQVHAAQRPITADRTAARHTTTVPALLAYPLFFHNQAVRVRGDLTGIEGQAPWYLQSDNRQVMVMPGRNGDAILPTGSSKQTDILGVFLDVGRLE